MARPGGGTDWRELVRETVRHPVRVFIGLAFVAIVATSSLVSFWRERSRYRWLGRKLGIYRGKVLRRSYQPGGLSQSERSSELHVITLRRGSWEDALKDLSDRARSAGYRAPSVDEPPSPAARQLYFHAPPRQGLPSLAVALYLPGEVIEDLGTEVPRDRTGLQFRLREYRPTAG